ncbi:DNA polymerase alpha subunit B [Anopheles nili]|uniref:DNA polymerase alpha subunit B n=1 Tax=Anopheles nili TaxID=185578 RepID=UPI00237B90B0|nr:DNA polymerase alpha subunit B [Anopheles nili]
MVSVETIREQFDELGIEPTDEVVNKCIEICINNDMDDPVEFVEQWMAYSVSKLSGAEPTVAYLNDMEAYEFTNKSRQVAKLANTIGGSGKLGACPRLDSKMPKITTYRNVDSIEQNVLEMYGCLTPKGKKSSSRIQHNVNTPEGGTRAGGSSFTTVTYSPLSLSSKKIDLDAPNKSGQIVYTYGSAKLLKQFNWLPAATGDGENGSTSTDTHPLMSDRDKRMVCSRLSALNIEINAEKFANDSSKYMFDSTYDRMIILSDRIYECGKSICNRLANNTSTLATKHNQQNADSNVKPPPSSSSEGGNNLDKEEPVDDGSEMHPESEDNMANWFDGIKVHHVDHPSSEPIRVLGRIIVESLSQPNAVSTSASNKKKLAIIDLDEHSLRYTMLDLSKVITPSWSVFSGQTVLLEGINPRGTLFTASKIHYERTLTIPRPPSGLDFTLTMVIASAPFTDSNDLLYEKFSSLMQFCSNNAPDVLILTGPFADANCKLYAEVAETFEEYFENMINTIMNKIGAKTEVFVVANHDDVVSSFAYPTAPYKVTNFYRNLHFLPDPCVFTVEGIEIGVTTVDVIKQLIESEYTPDASATAVSIGGDKIKRAYSHMFHQASFYPLNPPPENVPLDVDMLNDFGRLSRVPNVMICPSALNRYVREINGCICINPGFVDGHATDGSYARLIIQSPEAMTSVTNQQDTKPTYPSPASYIACQIVKT